MDAKSGARERFECARNVVIDLSHRSSLRVASRFQLLRMALHSLLVPRLLGLRVRLTKVIRCLPVTSSLDMAGRLLCRE
jgi:hypothetical protein